MAINSSQENLSLKRGLPQSTILNSDKCRQPEVLHHVQLNSTQEKALFNRASVRGRSRSPTESFAPLATSSSLDEQVLIKEQFCTDTVKIATCRTETSTVMPLLCPFECGVVFKTWTDQRQHLMKEHSCTDKEKNDFFDEREAEEKNNLRKTYLSNT